MPKQPYIPEKLPRTLDYGAFVDELTKAHASLARFDTVLSQLPDPRILEKTLITKEAVMSSQIEGTQATLEEVLEQEAKGDGREQTPKERDIQEILNYRRALSRGEELLKERPITENFIKELHRILLRSVRGHNRAPGDLRRLQVYIAPPGAPIEEATYIPPPPGIVAELFSNLDRYLNLPNQERDRLVQIAIAHFQLEAIHPFMDGNGRIGRLIIPLFLLQHKLISRPVLYASEYFERHREDYYIALRRVSEEGAWNDWIRFFLKAIEVQAQASASTVNAILQLHRSYSERIGEFRSSYASNVLQAIFMSPYFTLKKIRLVAHVKNNQTLINTMLKFIERGIVVDMTPQQKRNKIFSVPELIRALNAPHQV